MELSRGSQRFLNRFHCLPLPKSETALGMDQVTRTVKFIFYTSIKKKSHVSWCPPQIGRLAQRRQMTCPPSCMVGEQSQGTRAKLEIASRLLGSSVCAGSVSQPVNSADKGCTGPRSAQGEQQRKEDTLSPPGLGERHTNASRVGGVRR